MSEITNFNAFKEPLEKCSALIEASAGTGKTFAIAILVVRFIIEKNIKIDEILITTFTKKATNELKIRIRERLQETLFLFKSSENKIPESLKKDPIFKWFEDLDIDKNHALNNIQDALNNINNSKISTIHGFCSDSLKSFTINSGSYFDLKIIDEDNFKNQINLYLQDFWRNEVYSCVKTAEKYNEFSILSKDIGNLLFEKTYPNLQNITDYENANLNEGSNIKTLIDKKDNDISLFLVEIQKILYLSETNKFFMKPFLDHFKNIIAGKHSDIINTSNKKVNYDDIFNLLLTVKVKKSLSENLNIKIIINNIVEIRKLIRELHLEIEAQQKIDDVKSKNDIYINEVKFLLQAKDYVEIRMSKYLDENKYITEDGIIKNTLKAIENECFCGSVKNKYKVALIDEFQDTNYGQWNIFSKFFNNDDTYLFLIGDPKQGIYKFTGADIDAFFNAKKDTKKIYNLNTNYRSSPKMLECINKIFKDDKSFANEKLIYHKVLSGKDDSKEKFLSNSEDGCLNYIITKKGKSTEKYNLVANKIEKLLHDNENFSILDNGTKRNINANDIAIICRSNNAMYDFQKSLNKLNIKSIVSQDTDIFKSKEAGEILSIMKAFKNYMDNNFLHTMFLLPYYDFTAKTIIEKLINNQSEYNEFIMRYKNYYEIWEEKGFALAFKSFFELENFSDNLNKLDNYHRKITNLFHLSEIIEKVSIEKLYSTNQIIHWFENVISGNIIYTEMENNIRIEADIPAITLITIHKSKGLEYGIVFTDFPFSPFFPESKKTKNQNIKIYNANDEKITLIDCKKLKNINMNSDYDINEKIIAEISAEFQENLRLFYVSITRSKYCCYIICNEAYLTKEDYILNYLSCGLNNAGIKELEYPVEKENGHKRNIVKNNKEIKNNNFKPFVFNKKITNIFKVQSFSSLTKKYNMINRMSQNSTNKNHIQPEEILNYNSLPKGMIFGSLVHKILEEFNFKSIIAGVEEKNINNIFYKKVKYFFEKNNFNISENNEELLQFGNLFYNSLNSYLESDNDKFSLLDLESNKIIKEMEFLLNVKKINTKEIYLIVKNIIGMEKFNFLDFKGFMTGFIDVVFLHNNKYYLADYKSNFLNNYDNKSVLEAVKEKNYALQLTIYTIALDKYLSLNIENYNYNDNFGGAYCLFLRGMNNSNDNGIFKLKLEVNVKNKLSKILGIKSNE